MGRPVTPMPESLDRYRRIVEEAQFLMVGFDPDGRIRLFNRGAERITGVRRDDALGRNWFETFVPPSARPGERAAVEAVLMGEQSDARERPIRTSEGERWLQLHLGCTRDAGGEPALVFAVGVMTEERGLRQRAEQAERLAQAGRLAAGLAHEIRNPLNSAGLQLALLRRRIGDDRCDRRQCGGILDAVDHEVARIGALVADFLAYARPHRLQTAPTSLGPLLRDVVAAVAPPSTVHALVEASAPLTVEADGEKLRQVLLNLVRNALEAMPDGGSLTLRVREVSEGVEIDVEDTGAGVAPGARVFEAFFTTKSAGTGLGLAIVQRIVHDHGGEVRFASEPGRTTFSVFLPHRVADHAPRV